MKIIGLTGSIASGKSFVAEIFREMDIPVYDADAEVHKLLEPGGAAVSAVGAAFPEALKESGEIDRQILGGMVFSDAEKLQQLESILHPLVRGGGEKFINKAKAENKAVMVQDIPLLFETGADRACDYTIVVTVTKETQKDRALQREGMTEDKFEAINEMQLSPEEKSKRASYVIDGTQDKEKIREVISNIISEISNGKQI